MNIIQNYALIRSRIHMASVRVHRDPNLIKLVVVTKAQPVEKIRLAYEAGARDFGENYPEETLPKILDLEALPEPILWHMIGHLQSRKSAIVAKHFAMLHSLDSLRLAGKLENHLASSEARLPVLIEVNVSGEDSKYGWDASNDGNWPQILRAMEEISCQQHLSLQGLMTMPPLNGNPEASRPFFQKLVRLRDFLVNANPTLNLSELSMGTSFDFEVAIEEGATLLRIGQAIMGERLK